jgi:hypothetical protein
MRVRVAVVIRHRAPESETKDRMPATPSAETVAESPATVTAAAPPDPRPHALFINLASRPDRAAAVRAAWAPFFQLERLDAVPRADRGATGCALSHAKAMRWLEAHPHADTVTVLEDDAVPTPLMSLGAWAVTTRELARLPLWCVFNAGPCLLELQGADALQRVQRGDATAASDLYWSPMAVLAHCVVYHRRILPHVPWLEAHAGDAGVYADRWWVPPRMPRVLVCRSVYAVQAPSFSDIERAFRGDCSGRARHSALLMQAASDGARARERHELRVSPVHLQRIRVVHAVYGCDDAVADVAPLLRRRLAQACAAQAAAAPVEAAAARWHVAVVNDALGDVDPCPGRCKTLTLTLSMDGVEQPPRVFQEFTVASITGF